MKSVWITFVAALLSGLASASAAPSSAPTLLQGEAGEVFDYAYPLVIMKISHDLMLNPPRRERILPNHFRHFKQLAQPEHQAVVLGNRNTLYSVGWVDLGKGPVVFEIPDMEERYYVMPLLDAWTNTFASLGSRTTGQGPQKYFIVNQAWKGDAPNGYEVIVAPTNMVWITGRIQADSAQDAVQAARLQEGYTLMTWQEMRGEGNPFADYEPDFRVQEVRRPVPYTLKMPVEKFYDTFLGMWASNASPEKDAAMLAILGKAGIKEGGTEAFLDLAPEVQEQLSAGMKAKQAEYLKAFYEGSGQTTPWIFNTQRMGIWGTDYGRRAYWGMWGLGANLVEDSVYGVSQLDRDLAQLSGTNLYRIHFAAGDTPPVSAFWSVTTYNEEGYLERNDQDRYSLGSNHDLARNADGSLDMYLSYAQPKDTSLNWIPAPAGNFKVLLRLYRPEQSVLDGKWAPGPIEKVGPAR